ncbi:MAG TPA: PBP1A family penicillin-binding protein [Gemmatimonadaceae bacterium]|nr:PBP1A family penicillin-binding protein [Gemmatimonadaceae bacterium]
MRFFRRDFWRRHPRLTRALLLTGTFGLAFGAGFAYAGWALVCRAGQCPSIEVLEDYTPRQTSKLYAVDGRFIAEIGLERRTLVQLGEIPRPVRDAFLITEDKRFYSHAGIDWYRVIGAGLRNIRSGSYSQGFSTITMQLARNVFPERISREKTLVRKLKEAKVARSIEARYTKDKILELYLNQIYLGHGAYGVETASQRYFGKSARDLNVAEAATLAALPKAPERYNPRRYPDRAILRRNTVIELMRREGAVGANDANLARAYPLQLARRTESGDIAPYFVEWVRRQLDAQFGQQLYEQGLRVFTTLDLDMQSAAERAMESQLRRIESSDLGRYTHTTYEAYIARSAAGGENGGPNSPYLQGALVSLDPRTGSVRALVGGRDFDDSKFNRATQALRQPGSTFKPIVYAAAIQHGRAPSHMLEDSPLAVNQVDGTTWTPQNYDGGFSGWMNMRRALTRSVNIPAIRMGMELGEHAVIDMARRLGITSEIPPYPSIHIGAASVYPLELVAAYTAFATLGTRASPNSILRVENARGDILWEPVPVRVQVMSPEEAWILNDVMKDIVRTTGGTAYGNVWAAGFRIPSGGKTGTTNDYSDVWYLGYTADLVTGVWIGFDMPKRIMNNAQGGRLAAPAYTAFMKEVYQRKPAPPDWPRPEGIISREVDRTNGLLRNPFCPLETVYTEFFIPGTEPVRECDAHSPFILPPTDSGAFGAPLSPIQPGIRVQPGAVPTPQTAPPARDTTNPFYIPMPGGRTPPPASPPPAPPPASPDAGSATSPPTSPPDTGTAASPPRE